ncbi:MAG: T9SS type A sorting domain-containing protein [Chitinophagales bacterium]|nr:T9SS type A sorting domain-containing protein [Chitinophagales bacterium]MDW8419372.1 T9SS type A sorting domain-containing protein [Chitinophagales bacterium]
MKNHLVFFFSVFTYISVAQGVVYYNFENCTVSTSYEKLHTFDLFGNGNPGCLADWEVTNGTPSIYTSQDNYGSAFEGNQFMFLGVDNSVIGEGAALKYNFQSGKQYQITFARKVTPSNKYVNIDYVLLENPISYTYNYNIGASPVPQIPSSGSLVVKSETNVPSGFWQIINIITPVLNSNYGRIWFRPSYSNLNQGQVFTLFDSLTIQEVIQPDYCISFDTPLVTDKMHTFNTYGNGNPGFLQDWEVTNGTPSVYNSNDGFGPAYDGTQFMLLGVDNTIIGEGAALKFDFDAGKQYRITFARRNCVQGKFVNIDYVLLKNKINYTYNYNIGASPVPAIPSTGSLVLLSEQMLASGPWQVLNIVTPVLQESYHRLWFRPSFTNYNQGQVFALFDSLCITQFRGEIQNVSSSENHTAILTYPNPANQHFRIALMGDDLIHEVKLFDLSGKLLIDAEINHSKEALFNIDTLSSGIYLVNVTTSSGKRIMERLLVNK